MNDDYIERINYLLEPGHIYVSLKPTLIMSVLGTCVSITLWDNRLHFGGMNYFLYPFTDDPKIACSKYGNVAISTLIKMMLEEGSKPKNIEAQILGGALPKGVKNLSVSEENIRIARKTLDEKGISVISEDIGGHRGRKVVFDTLTGNVAIMKVPKIRKADWFPEKEADTNPS